MPDAPWIQPPTKHSEFEQVSDETVEFCKNAYNRMIVLAAIVGKKLQNPHSQRFSLNPRTIWAAMQIKRSWSQAAAAQIASAKAVRRAQEIYEANFRARSASKSASSGFDLDR